MTKVAPSIGECVDIVHSIFVMEIITFNTNRGSKRRKKEVFTAVTHCIYACVCVCFCNFNFFFYISVWF